MKLSGRERFLAALLPATVIVGLYFRAVRPSLEERIAAAEKRMAVSAAKPIDDEDMDRLAVDLAHEKNRKATIERKKREIFSEWSGSVERTATVREIVDLFEASGLRIENSTAELGDDATTILPPPFVETARTLKTLGAGDCAVWRFEIACNWDDLERTLSNVAGLPRFVIPVSVSIRPRENGDLLAVTLWCCI